MQIKIGIYCFVRIDSLFEAGFTFIQLHSSTSDSFNFTNSGIIQLSMQNSLSTSIDSILALISDFQPTPRGGVESRRLSHATSKWIHSNPNDYQVTSCHSWWSPPSSISVWASL